MIAKPNDAGESRQPLDGARPQDPAGDGLRILVAEDVEMNRLLVVTILMQAGHRAVGVEDGAAAVAAMRRHTFDLVLMDVNMPVMDGLEATRIIRGMAAPDNRTPIVALTATTFSDDIAHCRAAGMDGHIAKPIDRDTLLDEVDHRVAASRGRASRDWADPEAERPMAGSEP